MGIGMCIAGCAPAFTDMYIEALGDAGVKYGLQRTTAYRLAAKMVKAWVRSIWPTKHIRVP